MAKKKKPLKKYGDPFFGFRLPEQDAQSLRLMVKIYGAPTNAAFLREMVGAMCSGEVSRISAFNQKLMRAIGEQLSLDLHRQVMGEALEAVTKDVKTL